MVSMLVSQTNPVGVELFLMFQHFFSNTFARLLATWVKKFMVALIINILHFIRNDTDNLKTYLHNQIYTFQQKFKKYCSVLPTCCTPTCSRLTFQSHLITLLVHSKEKITASQINPNIWMASFTFGQGQVFLKM